jgi:UDP-N-acetylmuramyl pentapeptide phosphotransferase/UDP-N-acetylglucosamine-1-phosphate transferase
MDAWILIDVLSVMLVMLLTGMLTQLILLIAYQKNLFDIPDDRKIHRLPIPRLGGFTFLPAVTFAMLLVCGIAMVSQDGWLTQFITQKSLTECFFLVCSLLLLYAIGVVDDILGVGYIFKFAFQLFAAFFLVAGGFVINNLHGLFGIYELYFPSAVILTVLVVLLIINAMNLIDGIDGLSSGLSLIACAFYGYVAITNELYIYSLLAYSVFGALLLFFFFNVFGHVSKHKKIFMGDTGTMTIGLVLAALSIKICSMEQLSYDFNPAAVGFAPLLVPCLDVVRVYFHRIRNHKNPFLPDNNHIHHKLLSTGYGPHQTLVVILIFSAVLSVLNMIASSYVGITWIIIADIILWTIYNIYLTRKINKIISLQGEATVLRV